MICAAGGSRAHPAGSMPRLRKRKYALASMAHLTSRVCAGARACGKQLTNYAHLHATARRHGRFGALPPPSATRGLALRLDSDREQRAGLTAVGRVHGCCTV